MNDKKPELVCPPIPRELIPFLKQWVILSSPVLGDTTTAEQALAALAKYKGRMETVDKLTALYVSQQNKEADDGKKTVQM